MEGSSSELWRDRVPKHGEVGFRNMKDLKFRGVGFRNMEGSSSEIWKGRVPS